METRIYVITTKFGGKFEVRADSLLHAWDKLSEGNGIVDDDYESFYVKDNTELTMIKCACCGEYFTPQAIRYTDTQGYKYCHACYSRLSRRNK
jgi:hypothetical protein